MQLAHMAATDLEHFMLELQNLIDSMVPGDGQDP
jgi:hypothetical protein